MTLSDSTLSEWLDQFERWLEANRWGLFNPELSGRTQRAVEADPRFVYLGVYAKPDESTLPDGRCPLEGRVVLKPELERLLAQGYVRARKTPLAGTPWQERYELLPHGLV